MAEEMDSRPRFPAAAALGWTYAGTFARIGAQFFIGLTMARWLGPEPYGITAAALIPITLAGLLTNAGLASAVIQRGKLDSRDLAGAWWLQVALGLILALAIGLAAPAMARGLGQPGIVPVMRVMAIGLPVGAVGGMATAILMRDLRSKPVQIASVCSYLIGYGGIGLTLALKGAGVWAVALSQLSQSLIQGIILMAVGRPDLRHPRWPAGMVRFGAWSMLSNVTSWGLGNNHQALASRYLGVFALGHYNRFGLVTEVPISTFAAPVQQVLLPAMARAESAERRQELVCAAITGIGLLFIPAMGLLAIHSHLVVEVVFGPAFLPQAKMLVPMAVAAMLTALGCIAGPVVTGLGRPRLEWLLQLASFLLSIPILVISVRMGILALCWGLALLGSMRFLFSCALLVRIGVAPSSALVLAVGRALFPAVIGLATSCLPMLIWGQRNGRLALLQLLLAAGLGWAGSLLLGWRYLAPPALQRIAAHVIGRLGWIRGLASRSASKCVKP